jgi:hypothetical protein
MKVPKVVVRITGKAPIQAKVYQMQKLRCSLCGEIFIADTPIGIGEEKYDAASAAMIALLKYGSGLPFNRLQQLQGSLGVNGIRFFSSKNPSYRINSATL